MTATAPQPNPTGNPTILQMLAPIHHCWMEEVRRHIGPATAPRAGFQERWDALLYLTDRFEHAYALECAVLDQLRARLAGDASGRLVDERRAIDDLRAEFERIGCEQDIALPASAIARSLVAALRRWWSEIEQAMSGLRSGELSTESRDLLQELPAAFGPR
jgi:hypothetical protein